MESAVLQKSCLNCQNPFVVTSEDEALLKKIGETSLAQQGLPHPKLCPDCRQQRRLAFRNERWMYRRKCDFTGKDIISMYPPNSPFKVYAQNIWWSDQWDATEYGRNFDFSRPFFEQFRELQLAVPRLALMNQQGENSEYIHHSCKNKNCFMSSVTFGGEDIYYSDWIIDHCRDCVDCSYLLEGCELCYETYYAWGSYQAFFCDFVKRCTNVWFCYDCIQCQNCFMCWNLRNREYCVRNKQYSKENYEKYIAGIFPFSADKIQEFRKEYIKAKEYLAAHAGVYELQCTDSYGDLMFHSKNCFYCFDSIRMEDCRYCYDNIDLKDSLDNYHVGWAELMYECHAISNGYNCLFCHFTYDNRSAVYSDCTQNCNHVFGCVGLNRKSYCILNKQYSKEAYEELVPRIIEHMIRTGEFGEFFPIQFSPFSYNQSRAQEYYPLTKEQALAKNISWSDYEPSPPMVSKTVSAEDLPQFLDEAPADILQTAILCEVSKKPFKIIKQEFDFYKKTGLPLPRRHPDARYFDRMKQRNPRKLWNRKCQKCFKEIFSSFHPERNAPVYCQECYQKILY
ncbi:hypothetical protein HYV57_03085 [Candidatus Peregrinibacteria bacterium]|nr:hypothetical protein [Candidatus Peregrinibacteria bacterium]